MTTERSDRRPLLQEQGGHLPFPLAHHRPMRTLGDTC